MKRDKKIGQFINKFNSARETARTVGKALIEPGALTTGITKTISEGIALIIGREATQNHTPTDTTVIKDVENGANCNQCNNGKNQAEAQNAQTNTEKREESKITIHFSANKENSENNECITVENLGATVQITGPNVKLRYLYDLAETLNPTRIGFESIPRTVKNYYIRELRLIYFDKGTWEKICKLENIGINSPKNEDPKNAGLNPTTSNTSANVYSGKDGLKGNYHIN